MRDYDAATYGDRMARIYDEAEWMHEPFEAAVAFLAPLAANGTALELGIGTGRVALPLAKEGVRVTGIDASAAMLDVLRTKPGAADIELVLGDFVDAGPPAQYDLVFCVYNTLYLLRSQQEQVRCLANVAARLRPDAAFVVEVSVMPFRRLNERQFVDAVRIDADEAVVALSQHDPVSQTVTRQQIVLRDGRTEFLPMCYRYLWPSELDLMAALAGLSLEQRYGGWTGQEFTGSGRHVSVYRKEAG